MADKLTRQAPKRIKNNMLQAEALKTDMDAMYKQTKEITEALKEGMVEEGIDEYIVDDGEDKVLSALVYENVQVQYDFEKLKQKLDKQQLNEISNSLLVVDEAGMQTFLRQYPELRKHLKRFISKVRVLNERKLDIAFEQGIVTLKHIRGCYTKTSRHAIRIQRVKRKE